MLKHPTRFILIETSHAGNIGAVARAMKVMNFDDLVLVRPRWNDALERKEAIQLASGAVDILEKARVVNTLNEALEDITHVCATAMVQRDFGPRTFAPRNHFESLTKNMPKSIAFLFGTERWGMSNEDVYRSHAVLQIPTNPEYGSLNIAAAAQVLAYEWRQCLDAANNAGQIVFEEDAQNIAHAAHIGSALINWQEVLIQAGFLNPASPKKLMPRLNAIVNRARPTKKEVDILRGIAASMQRHISSKDRI